MSSPGVQCPKCRAVSYPELMGFPRCHRCHEQLRQCRYCTHQERGLCKLPLAPHPPLNEEDGRPYCDAFESALTVGRGRGPLSGVIAGEGRVVAVMAILVILVLGLLLAAIGDVRQGLRIEAQDERVVVQDGRAVVEFTIHGDPGVQSTVILHVEPDALAHCRIESPLPLAYPPQGPEYKQSLPISGRARFQLTLLVAPDAAPRFALTVVLLDDHRTEWSRAVTSIVSPRRRAPDGGRSRAGASEAP